MRGKHVADTYTLYGGELSYFSGKARAYLRYKGIPFDEKLATLDIYKTLILPRTGVSMIPAMHYRWNFNRDFAEAEFGKVAAPDASPAEQIEVGRATSRPFAGALPFLGVTPETIPGIEASYEGLLSELNAHFTKYPFLFGDRPSIGDFGLFGPLYAHLYRDPESGKLMRRLAPEVSNWVERLIAPVPKSGSFLPDDEMPETLLPLLRRIAGEQLPLLVHTVEAFETWLAANPDTPLPRAIGRQTFSLPDKTGRPVTGQMGVRPYSQWMFQRALDYYQSLSGAARGSVDAMLDGMDAKAALTTPVRHRVKLENYKLAVA